MPDATARHLTAVPTEADYDSFCATLSATERGRWFLAEYTRRNRNADTNVLLTALDRIEHLVRAQGPELDRVQEELRVLLDTLRPARPDVDATVNEKLRAMKLIALVNLLERRIEGIVDKQRPMEPVTLADVAPSAEAAPEPPARVALKVVPPPDEPQLPLPTPASEPRAIALVLPPAPPTEAASLIDLELEDGDWHPARDEHFYAPFDLEAAEQIARETPPQVLPEVGFPAMEKADPLAALRALSDEERLALFS